MSRTKKMLASTLAVCAVATGALAGSAEAAPANEMASVARSGSAPRTTLQTHTWGGDSSFARRPTYVTFSNSSWDVTMSRIRWQRWSAASARGKGKLRLRIASANGLPVYGNYLARISVGETTEGHFSLAVIRYRKRNKTVIRRYRLTRTDDSWCWTWAAR